MWDNNYSSEDIYFKSEAELEQERLTYLQYQIEEKKTLEEEQRLQQAYDDEVLENNVYRQREKLRLEYEADQANQQYKEELASRRRDTHFSHLEAFAKQAEEERKAKYKGKLKAPGERNPEVPLIIVDSVADDRPIRPAKKTPSKGSNREGTAKPNTNKEAKETATPNTKKESKGAVKPNTKRGESTANPKKTSITKQKSLPEDKMSRSLQRSKGSHRGERKELHYRGENLDEINIKENDGKRRRLPASKTNDFGINLDNRSKSVVANDQTFTNSVFDEFFDEEE